MDISLARSLCLKGRSLVIVAEGKTLEQLAIEYVILSLDLKSEYGEIRPVIQQMMVNIGDQIWMDCPELFQQRLKQATDSLKLLGVQFDD